MSAFDTFLQFLDEQGFQYDTGFLIPRGAVVGNLVGYRLQTNQQQIDLYIRDEFWDASKSHPKLGESQEIANGVTVRPIVK